MVSKSDKFERTVWRIHQLLEQEGADVTWNERVADPDTPAQSRQVDVLVRRPNYVFMVECRDHAVPQDVKWIEELHGRRESLNANGIGAASTSGFTAPAIAKAARFRIPLYDLSAITDDEIAAWGRTVTITIYAYKFENFVVRLEFPKLCLDKLDATTFPEDLASYYGLRAIFSPASNFLDGKDLLNNPGAKYRFGVLFQIPGMTLQGFPVQQIETTGLASLETIELQIPETLTYTSTEFSAEPRQLIVQNFNLGETQAIHKDGVLAVTLDLAALDLPPYWQFRYCRVSGDHIYDMDSFELLSPDRIPMKVDRLTVALAEMS